jgi:hypothetical protein
MSRRSLGSALAAIGIIVVAISALADQIGIGDEEAFGLQQVLGVVIGVLIVVAGFVIARLGDKPGNDSDA